MSRDISLSRLVTLFPEQRDRTRILDAFQRFDSLSTLGAGSELRRLIQTYRSQAVTGKPVPVTRPAAGRRQARAHAPAANSRVLAREGQEQRSEWQKQQQQ